MSCVLLRMTATIAGRSAVNGTSCPTPISPSVEQRSPRPSELEIHRSEGTRLYRDRRRLAAARASNRRTDQKIPAFGGNDQHQPGRRLHREFRAVAVGPASAEKVLHQLVPLSRFSRGVRDTETLPVADQLFAIDGKRITCSGGIGVAYLAAHIVELRMGRPVRRRRCTSCRSTAWNRDPRPNPRRPPIVGEDSRISRTLLIMEQNLSSPLSVAKLAAKVNLSTRQLERLFKEEAGQPPGRPIFA